VKLRSLKNYTKEAFNVLLHGVDWRDVLECDTVEEARHGVFLNVNY